jgi:voltage-gated potassium channel
MLMILGYGVIAVPTGIVSAEITRTERGAVTLVTCSRCDAVEHRTDALLPRL